MAMSEKDKRMAAMKRKFDKTTPSNRTGQTIMQRIKNDIFGNKKGTIDDDVAKTDKTIPKYRKNPPKAKTVKKDTRLSPGALGGKIKITIKNKIKPIVKKDNKTTKSKSKVKATAGNTKGFASTMAMQKKLIKMGAKINADGIMGPKTRAAMAKFMKAPEPKSRPTTKKNVSQGSTIAKDRGKTGFGSKSMSTKTPKTYKGTNVTPSKLQKDRMRKRMMGST